MIYDFPGIEDPIKQGDIFRGIPRVEVELSEGLSVSTETGDINTIPWEEIIANKEQAIAAIFGVSPVTAIVVSQTCDANRDPYVTLCEIVEISEIDKGFATDKQPKALVKEIINKNVNKPNLFYLPPDPKMAFVAKMGVDFSKTLRVSRNDIENLKKNRCGRLKQVPYDHFREKLSYFFHRYAFSEWYPLNKDEIQYYEHIDTLKETDFFGWQR